MTSTGSLTLEEICVIRRTAQRLSTFRSRKFIQTWFSIIFFLGSVCGGYLRAVDKYDKLQNSQTAHTLAIVMLFSWLVVAVYVNGHFGNFYDEREVMRTINEMRTGSPETLGDLFPELHFRGHKAVSFGTLLELHRAHDVYVGIINSWRPDKQLQSFDLDDRSVWILLLASLLAVVISWGTAFTISYRTPTIGYGCRSLAWTVIAIAWVINAILDTPGGIVITAQLGIMNTCWCRGGLTANPTVTAVEIGPPTASMRRESTTRWLCTAAACLTCTFVIIAYVALDGENGRLLFVRSQAESMAEQRAIQH